MTANESILEAHGYCADLTSSSRDAFLRACKDGPTEVVRAYLDLGMPVDARVDISLETALIKAAEGGSVERLELLLSRGASLELVDSSQDTALRTALNWSQPEAARFLASRGADLTAMNKYGETALEHAVSKGQPDNARLLLELGADPNAVHLESARSACRRVIEQGDQELLALMLDKGLRPELVLDTQGARPLHYAIRAGNSAMVEALVARGASALTEDAHRTSALDYALSIHAEHLVESLGGEALPADAIERARKKAAVWTAAAAGSWSDAIEALSAAEMTVDSLNGAGRTLLALACESRSLEGIDALLKAGADPNVELPSRNTAIAFFAEGTSDELVERLISGGARAVNSRGEPQWLGSAVWYQYEAQVRMLLATRPAMSAKGWGEALYSATMQRNATIVRLLHEAGADLGWHQEIGGETALHGAVTAYRSDEVIAYLLGAGADPNARNDSQFTPLHSAVQHYEYNDSYLDVLRALIAAGARLDAVDTYTRTPYDAARDESKRHLVELVVNEPLASGASLEVLASKQSWATLAIWYEAGRRDEVLAFIERGVSVDAPPDVKAAPLVHAAIDAGDVELVRILLARGADAKRVEHYGTSMIQLAAGKGSIELFELFLERGADPRAFDDFHGTAIHAAAAHPELLRWIIERGISVDFGPAKSPMLSAVGSDNVESVRLLLDAGVSPNGADSYGNQPIFSAIEKGNAEVVALLCAKGQALDVVNKQTGDTPITAAAKAGNASVVRALIDAGADLTAKTRDDDDGLALIARRKELRREFADVLAAHGVDTSSPASFEPLEPALREPSPWFVAVYRGDLEAMKQLVAQTTVDERDAYGATALMYAIDAQRADLVEWLLDAGADVRAKDASGTSVSGYAPFQSDPTIDALIEARAGSKLLSMDVLNERAGRSMLSGDARKLLERGELKKLTQQLRDRKLNPFTTVGGYGLANLAVQRGDEDLLDFISALGLRFDVDLRGMHPLVSALQSGAMTLAETLVARGVSLDAKVNGRPLVLEMLVQYNESAAQWLVERGAAATDVDDQGRTALHIAAQNGFGALGVSLVAAHPALARARDATGRTPLHEAVSNWWGSEAIARAVIALGGTVDVADNEGRTPLHVALEVYGEDAARALFAAGASWDFVAEGVEGARSPRELAEEFGIDPAAWPPSLDDTPQDDLIDA